MLSKILLVVLFSTMLFAFVTGEDGVVMSGKGFTRSGKQGYTRLQVTMDFSKFEGKSISAASKAFMILLKNAGHNAVGKGIEKYDVLPDNIPLTFDNVYFGQNILKNYVLSVETSIDGGKEFLQPRGLSSSDYPSSANADGLWRARSLAIYPLKSDSENARDENATLDLAETSALSGDVWIGFLPGMNMIPERIRYTIDSLDGTPIMKREPDTALRVLLCNSLGQTPNAVAEFLKGDPADLRHYWNFSSAVKFEDGGSYDEDGPIKTTLASVLNSPYAEEAKKNIEKMQEESKKLEMQFETERAKMAKEFEDMRNNIVGDTKASEETIENLFGETTDDLSIPGGADTPAQPPSEESPEPSAPITSEETPEPPATEEAPNPPANENPPDDVPPPDVGEL